MLQIVNLPVLKSHLYVFLLSTNWGFVDDTVPTAASHFPNIAPCNADLEDDVEALAFYGADHVIYYMVYYLGCSWTT